METKPTRQFPDAFDGIQVGTIGREVVQTEVGCLGLSPGLVHFRMMKPGIVRDDHDASASLSAPRLKELQEVPEALPIKSIRFSLIDEPPVTQAHRPKISDALARGVVQEDRVAILWGHPQAAAGAVLLKMDLIQCPEVHVRRGIHRSEFFLCSTCRVTSARAITGRGLTKRNPHWRKNRRHCRAPRVTPKARWMWAASVFPSHRLPLKPKSTGRFRNRAWISTICGGVSRGGRPGRAPSCNPAKPFVSNRRTQYSTVRGASPNKSATRQQFIPSATSNTPCKRWSYRDSALRRISSCNPKMMTEGSAIVSAFMPYMKAHFTIMRNYLCPRV